MNSKRKGNAGEHAFARWWQSVGLGGSMRNTMSGGSIWKGDVSNDKDLCIEIKTVKKINLQELWRQVSRDAGQSHATPLAAIRFDHMPEDKWLMIMDSADWQEMFKRSLGEKQVVEVPRGDSREMKYAMERLRNAVREVQKYL